MEILKITKKVHRDYKNNVKGNLEEGYMKTRKKLTRNWLLGEFLNENEEYEWRAYGCLTLCLHKATNRIVNLLNFRYDLSECKIDKVYKDLLSKELNIW